MEATLQSIFRHKFIQYQQQHGLTLTQYKAAQAIMNCRTDAFGYEEWGCNKDEHIEHHAHSCRNRSCPRCQGHYTHDWLDKTQSRLLKCDHYHVVFTLPHELNEVWQFNRQWSTEHLFKAAAETLQQLLRDERYLGADVGILASIHTWGRTLSFHPHVHILVTGGGLSSGKWRPLKKDFLLPVGVLKAKFRGKWLSWLNTAYAQGKLHLPAHWSERDWMRILATLARKKWNIHIQGPYKHGAGVVNYLSRYVHGGPIKDRRIINASDTHIDFRYRDHRDGKDKRMVLKTEDFIRRVLWHVPEKGQHTVRYYGLYVPGARALRDKIREQQGESVGERVPTQAKPEKQCPICGGILLHRLSVRRKISYIKNKHSKGSSMSIVQQGVQVNRDGPGARFASSGGFFTPGAGHLT